MTNNNFNTRCLLTILKFLINNNYVRDNYFNKIATSGLGFQLLLERDILLQVVNLMIFNWGRYIFIKV